MSNETRMPLLGDKFPELKVVTTRGVKQLPGDYKGRWFILFSHPAGREVFEQRAQRMWVQRRGLR